MFEKKTKVPFICPNFISPILSYFDFFMKYKVVGEEKSRNGKNTFLYHRATEALKQIYLEHNLNEPKRKIAKFGIILSP